MFLDLSTSLLSKVLGDIICNDIPCCKNCNFKIPPEQIKKHKQYTKEMVSTIVENRGGHPEPLEQVISYQL